MTHTCWLQLLTLQMTLLVSASVAHSGTTDKSGQSIDGTVVYMMPLHNADAKVSDAVPAGDHLTFFSGPSLKNISVHPVYWNSTTQFRENLNAFYNAVTGSAWWNVLSQYGVGPGSGVAGIVDTRATANVSDATVTAEIVRLIVAGRLPAPNSNTYYPVHFPAGMSITAPNGSQSCVVFCAYHGTFVLNGVTAIYGIIPDQGGGCDGSCGGNALRVNNLDAISSGQLADAATGPSVGGGVADLCFGHQGTTVGRDGMTYVIQLLWSNAANACVAQ